MVLAVRWSGADADVKSSVLRRIALLVSITPGHVKAGGELHVSNVDTQRELSLASRSFVLELDSEPRDSFVRGQLRMLRDGTTYPVQSNVALFEMLQDLIDRDAGAR
jgi:hypothetical protein